MRVAVDARLLQGGGIGRYIREVTGRWLSAEGIREIRFLGRPSEIEPWVRSLTGSERAGVVSWEDSVYSPRAQLRWASNGANWTRGCNVTFFPHWDCPVHPAGPPRVVTVHDLIHFLEPGGFPAWKRLAGKWLLSRSIRSAAAVVTVSDATRKDLDAWVSTPHARVRVIANGVPHELFRTLEGAEKARALERWGHLCPFLLVVGPLKPHKGVATALRALKAALRSHPDLRLVQAGPPDMRDPEVLRVLKDPEIEGRFVQVGVMDDGALNELYNLSECLLHPARREGFGLPPVEAMAAGTAVLASDSSSLPEVVGDGGRLLDPGDPDAWSRAILELLEGEEVRDEWIRRGRAWVRRFSWERAAGDTLDVIRSVAAGRDVEGRGRPG